MLRSENSLTLRPKYQKTSIIRTPIIILLIAALCWSCETTSTEGEGHGTESMADGITSLQGEVMAVHDAAMAKMGDIQRLMGELETKASELEAEGRAEEGTALRDLIAQLNEADQGMRDWMRGYDISAADPATEGAQEYLEDQMAKIETVREDMLSSIEAATEALSTE